MNESVNKLFVAGGKFMTEMHLRQPRFTCSTCGTFKKNKERIQKNTNTIQKKHETRDIFIKMN